MSRSTLPQLSRKQLLDALVWLARDRDDAAVKAQVLELALEYIGRRWREEDRMFESVAKKLAEVEAEVSWWR